MSDLEHLSPDLEEFRVITSVPPSSSEVPDTPQPNRDDRGQAGSDAGERPGPAFAVVGGRELPRPRSSNVEAHGAMSGDREREDSGVDADALHAFQQLAAHRPSVFTEAVPTTYHEYLGSSGQPVYGIPVICRVPSPTHVDGGLHLSPQHQHIHHSPAQATYTQAVARHGPAPGHVIAIPAGGDRDPPAPGMPPRFSVFDLAALGRREDSEQLRLSWHRSRSVRIYAVADLFIVCLLILSRYWVAALLPFPICGFVGAKSFQQWMILAYLCYFPLILSVRAYVGYDGAANQNGGSAQVILIVLSVLGGLAEIYIFAAVIAFWRALRTLSADTIDQLRRGWEPPGESGTSWFWS